MALMRSENWLKRLDAARAGNPADLIDLCLDALEHAPGPPVARAMSLLRRLDHDGHALLSLGAFDRLCVEGGKRDLGCTGRRAIAESLLALDWTQSEPWLTGMRLVQWEPVYGGRVDTAAGLRGICGLGLARMGDPEAPLMLAVLLADGEVEARRGAIRALRESPALWALPLLAHRALLRIEDVDAQLDLFHGLLERESNEARDLVAGFLEDHWEVGREAAAMALGERGGAAGAALLWSALEQEFDPRQRRSLWLGLALSRCAEGRGALLLKLVSATASMRGEVRQALDGIQDAELEQILGDPKARTKR